MGLRALNSFWNKNVRKILKLESTLCSKNINGEKP